MLRTVNELLSWTLFTELVEEGALGAFIEIKQVSLAELEQRRAGKLPFERLKVVSEFDSKRRLVYDELSNLFQRSVETYVSDNHDLLQELLGTTPLPLTFVSSVLDPGKLIFGKKKD